MGFIEDLRKQKATEAVVNAEAKRIAKEKKDQEFLEWKKQHDLYEAEQQRLNEQRPKDYSEYWQKAKGYFEESGLRGMLNQLVDIEAGSISEEKDNKYLRKRGEFDMAFDVVFNKSDGRYILMRTGVDGGISFNAGINGNGAWNNGESVSRKKWTGT